MRPTTKLAIVPAAALALVGLSACSGAKAHSGSSPSVANVIQMDVLTGKLATKYGITAAADNRGHDSFSPSEFTLKAGQTYTVNVYNYDEGPHTFSIDGLNINETINPHVSDDQPSITTFTIKIDKAGAYRFYCKLPCDAGQAGWAMTDDRNGQGKDQNGFMAGYVNVIA